MSYKVKRYEQIFGLSWLPLSKVHDHGGRCHRMRRQRELRRGCAARRARQVAWWL